MMGVACGRKTGCEFGGKRNEMGKTKVAFGEREIDPKNVFKDNKAGNKFQILINLIVQLINKVNQYYRLVGQKKKHKN
jgi:hypothetical protein